MAQSLLPFQYEEQNNSTGLTSKAGLGLYLELMAALGLPSMVAEQLQLRPSQGWSDVQHIVALVLLHLVGGEFLEDLEWLEADEGLCEIIEDLEQWGMHPSHETIRDNRWRIDKNRTFPSPDSTTRYLKEFDGDTEQMRQQVEGAYVPERTDQLEALRRIVGDIAGWSPDDANDESVATLDIDATVLESNKRSAKPTYKGFRGFQPLNIFWFERMTMLASEFRDGNCPAGWRNLEVLQQGLDELPDAIDRVRMRTDTAGYDHRLLKYCADGADQRFGTIEFAVGVDITESFRKAVGRADNWQRLEAVDEMGNRYPTGQEYARVNFVPDWLTYTKRDLGIRFFAIREPMRQQQLIKDGDVQQTFSFPTMNFPDAGRSKLFGVVTNRQDLSGDEVIRWHRKRCGASEKVHSQLKGDLAGDHPPFSDCFGGNCAWWQITLLAYNLHVLMQRYATGPDCSRNSQDSPAKFSGDSEATESDECPEETDGNTPLRIHQIKTERFRWLNIPGRIVRHARRLIIRLPRGHPAVEMFAVARRRIAGLVRAPPNRWLPAPNG